MPPRRTRLWNLPAHLNDNIRLHRNGITSIDNLLGLIHPNRRRRPTSFPFNVNPVPAFRDHFDGGFVGRRCLAVPVRGLVHFQSCVSGKRVPMVGGVFRVLFAGQG